jgi:hypothetical protein
MAVVILCSQNNWILKYNAGYSYPLNGGLPSVS